MKSLNTRARLEEIDKLIAELKTKMAWTPGWLKVEINDLIKLEVEKAKILKRL